MDPIQPPTQEPVQIPDFQPKPNYLKTTIFSVLIVITIGLITYLFFQNQKLQKQVLNPPVSPTIQVISPTPKTVSSISIPPDETAGWKTYTDQENGFSIKYPSDYLIETDSIANSTFINKNIEIKTNSVSFGDEGIDTIINSNKFIKFESYVGEIGGNIAQKFILYEFKLNNMYLTFKLQVTPFKLSKDDFKNYFVPGKILEIDDNKKVIFDQILSTFKFVSEPSKCLPVEDPCNPQSCDYDLSKCIK